MLCPWSNNAINKNTQSAPRNLVVLGIQIGTKEKLRYEHEKDQTEMELCIVWREYKWMVQEKGWKSHVVQALGPVSVELGASS